jgi:probable rRNA maturation factor
MSRTTETTRGVEIDLSLPCASWRRALPAVGALARQAAEAALARSHKRIGRAELSLVLADDAAVRALNARWRGKDAPTNVLAFPVADPTILPPDGAPLLLGDIVLAYETVSREAEEQHKPLADHLRHLVVHGVLHLLGYDHTNPADAAAMEDREIAILAELGVPNPYRDII